MDIRPGQTLMRSEVPNVGVQTAQSERPAGSQKITGGHTVRHQCVSVAHH